MAKLNDQVVDDSVFATTRSRSAAMLGITALRPGSNSAQNTVSRNNRMYNSHNSCGPRTNNMHSTMAARDQSAQIITFLRLMRSLTTPAAGATKNSGNTCTTKSTATQFALAGHSSD